MVVTQNSEKEEHQEKVPSTPGTPDSEQLTICSIVSFTPDLVTHKDTKDAKVDIHPTGPNQVESRKTGKSMDPEKLPTIQDIKHEKWYSLALQIFVPFMVAGVGTIGAGIVLGEVETYEVFQDVSALFILVPALLGLKGNLDMCLASRLSTQVNLGKMDSKQEIFKMVVGNIGLVQVQAIVAACLVAIFAVCASAIMNGNFDWNNSLLLITSSILTATLSCFILDFVLVGMVFLTNRFKLNPDNLATPLAASIGDVVSLIVLSTWASLLYAIHDTYGWIMYIIDAVYIFGFLPMWIVIVKRNEYTKKILTHGWTPVLSALIISGFGGLVLDNAVDEYPGFVVFQPIINGIGGNLVSIQSSRISTLLHKTSLLGILPPHAKQWVAPWTALIKGAVPAKTARILIAISIIGQTSFVFAANAIYNEGQLAAGAWFVLSYLAVAEVQLMLLLYIAHIMTHSMWKYKIDPDNSAIPYLTALGDLSGTSLLLLAFMFLKAIGHEYTPISSKPAADPMHPT